MNQEQRKFRKVIKRRRKAAAHVRAEWEKEANTRHELRFERAAFKRDRKKAAEHNTKVMQDVNARRMARKQATGAMKHNVHRSTNFG